MVRRGSRCTAFLHRDNLYSSSFLQKVRALLGLQGWLRTLLMGRGSEQKAVWGRLGSSWTACSQPVLLVCSPAFPLVLWDNHMVRICLEDTKGFMEASKAFW